ncbi:oxidoreductase [Streptomyces sp. PKU-EA00015]|uniref:oxidoreductase n=1 Tax=Streptomyces sp. PKU-EA00015 TaxID=2748326 RepID=UPI0015A2A553|nr:oxidoreductase [Streptomyces sp. PKU-EA00015]NWF31157.1 oxidoreductase [Streptomyces sp. PKU-EA00015]
MLSYDELTQPERELWDAFPEGRLVDLRTGVSEADGPAAGAQWGSERSVRAAVVAALLLGANAERSGVVAALRLAGARITGRLDLSGAEICHTFWFEDCWLEEAVSLYGAATRTIGIANSWVPGIDAGLARIDGALDLRRSTLAGGSLTLINARVAGELILTDARISGPGEWAVLAGGLVMEGGVFGKRLTTQGGLRLPGAHLPKGLFLQGARLENADGVALAAGHVAASTVDCSQGFTAQGTVRLRSARIEDLLTFEGAHLNGDGTALVCIAMHVGDFDFRAATPPSGTVDLRSAHATWCQDSERAWPEEVLLEGFTYGSIRFGETASTEGGAAGEDGTPVGDTMPAGDEVASRLAWIRRNPGYAPQPYEQLAGWYRQIGHDGDARRVLLAKQRHRRRTLHPAGRIWGHLLDATVGYGYRPWLAGVWLIALALLGTLVFGAHSPTPVKPGEGAPFQSFVYTLDLLIPIGGLGQRTAWYWTDSGSQWLAYVLIAAGWVLTTAVVAGVTRTLNRN